ncbi:YkgJ family cysteine cluster protein [Campylobacter corcagiensis]|uniref:YkgJ family cysteine cluster protein n=1 Tax=Campylobacter corcagiensis TaxID=1448857 RepID=A0A7M1LG88_9BACT|nr:YkgJ family cysteine cluster protein [Campylobacter corcagiensis]QKF64499.1 putative [Fe-S] cluster-containing protein [Campylobacter corcagiensis]QOQ87321.1 YkgJ family cysteine cluster protein [Campylobacter corcagiensis]
MCDLIKKSGFDYGFDPKACERCAGKCCIGDSGYIWIDESEIVNLSKFLKISPDAFKDRYLDKFGLRYSIKELKFKDGYACCFFDQKALNCSIYDYRPKQCMTFPFWDYFKHNFKELERECIGVKR